ncbi:MAG TPA: hypothetical protein VII58_00865 [Acidobacteriaceae bacterium]
MPLLLLASCLLQKERKSPPPWAHVERRIRMRSSERDNRSGRQILESARDYCNWRSTRGKHAQLTHLQRFHHDRLWYLNGVTGITDAMYAPRLVPIAIALPVLDPAPCLDPRAQSVTAPRVPSSPAKVSPAARLMAARSRGWIVDELLRVNPALTDKKLLLRLSHLKLSGMLVTARAVQRRAGPARRAKRKKVPLILPKRPKSVVPLQSFPAPLRGAA